MRTAFLSGMRVPLKSKLVINGEEYSGVKLGHTLKRLKHQAERGAWADMDAYLQFAEQTPRQDHIMRARYLIELRKKQSRVA